MRNALLIYAVTAVVAASAADKSNDTKSGALAALQPQEYSDLHIAASDLKDPKWADSMRELAKVGDSFTLEHLKTLDAQKLGKSQTEILQQTLATVRERVAKEDLAAFVKLIQIRLERAAWADLSCSRLETTLTPWTLALIRKRLDKPEVVAELKRIQAHYVPSVEMKTLFSSMKERVPGYAKRILSAKRKSEN